jgi:hypothetical protein
MDPYAGVDLAHLAECIDPHCWYCNDETPDATMSERERIFLEVLVRADDHPLAA